jgi:hypothetical protein
MGGVECDWGSNMNSSTMISVVDELGMQRFNGCQTDNPSNTNEGWI